MTRFLELMDELDNLRVKQENKIAALQNKLEDTKQELVKEKAKSMALSSELGILQNQIKQVSKLFGSLDGKQKK